MLIHFYIKFTSEYGDSLHINFPGGDGDAGLVFPLNYLDESYWSVSIQSAALPDETLLTYSVIFDPMHGSSVEIIHKRKIDIKKVKQDVVEIYDGPLEVERYEKIFSSTPFIEILKNQNKKVKKYSDKTPNTIFKVQVPPMAEGKILCITGSSKKFKKWDEKKPLLLTKNNNTWSIRLNLTKELYPIEYKFGIYDLKHIYPEMKISEIILQKDNIG
jgi:4-alpha-glucanotransferase